MDTKIYDYGDRYTDPTRVDQRRVRRKHTGTAASIKNISKSRGWQVAEMWDSHHEIARRLILGEKNVDIAKALGCSPQIVGQVRNSPVVQDKLTIMRAARDAGTIEVARQIQDLAPIALLRVKEALETGKVLEKEVSAANILKEANNVIDRTEGKPTQRVDTRSLNMTLTVDDIQKIKDRAKFLAGAGESFI